MQPEENDDIHRRRRFLTLFAAAAGLAPLAAISAARAEAGPHDHGVLNPDTLMGPGKIPEAPVETHEGKQVRLYEDLIKGKVATINFMTIDNEEDFPISRRLAETAKLLGDRLGTDAVMVSITADPESDTVERLKAFAEKIGAPRGWYFVRAAANDSSTVATRLYRHGRKLGGPTMVDLVHYGNETVGLWAAYPALIAAEDAAIRIRSVMSGSPDTGELRRAGPRLLDAEGPDYHHREI